MVFFLFVSLIIRLGFVQIVKGEEYKLLVEQSDITPVSSSVPRGEIYDREYNLVVYNIPVNAISYTPPKNPKQSQLLELAKRLDKLITMNKKDKEKVTTRDMKDIWLLENENGKELITNKEKQLYNEDKLQDEELYRLKLERIKENDLMVNKNIAAIYRKLSSAISLNQTFIKNENVTIEEYARVAENLESLPGVDVSTDWIRGRTYGDTFWNMLGEVTNHEEGLPAEKVDQYTAKGYKLNERIGKSYIEEMYDDVLQGQKELVKTQTDKKGYVINSEVVKEGQSGKDIVLTIDMGFQAEVETIIQEELIAAMKKPNTDTLDTAFVVAMMPKTGQILAMSGKVYDREHKEFHDYTAGTFTYAFEQGSVVKGATLLTGYQTGVRDIGETDYDEPLRIKGTKEISSYTNMGMINDLTALERSSNVYMWKTAIELLGDRYIPNQALNIKADNIEKIRYYFNQFGLGVYTGIGFDNETSGIKGTDARNYFQIAIGQLDTYTPLQIAQYISTIANDGFRMKPQLVREIRKPSNNNTKLGDLINDIEPVVLNRIDMNDEMIQRVQDGLWLVTHGSRGTASQNFKDEPFHIAGKTGTAESFKKGIKTWNLSFAGYAPFEDPEIAIAVIVPNAYRDGFPQPHSAANIISKRIFRAYFEQIEKGNNK
jgi:penicillin-binding protein A